MLHICQQEKNHYVEAFLYLILGKNYHYQQKTSGACVLPPGTGKVSAMCQIPQTKTTQKHSFPVSDFGYK